jgi:hypothetical protein
MKRFLLFLALFVIFCGGEDLESQPQNLSWGNIDTDGDGVKENYLTPIKRQKCWDCYVYAAVGLLEIQYKIDHKSIPSLDLSEQNVHNCLRIPCRSSGDSNFILNYIRDYGVIEERYASIGKWKKCENCDGGSIIDEDGPSLIEHIPFFRARSWRIVVPKGTPYNKKKQMLVDALQTGPVIINVSSWNGFKRSAIRRCTGFVPGAHAAIVVGYENYGEIFLVKNSHGEASVIKMAFKDGDKCKFAHVGIQIDPGTTYISYGSGQAYCYSQDDRDGDSVPDVLDNCPWDKNTDQKNSDEDPYGDMCDKCPTKTGINGLTCAPKHETMVMVPVWPPILQ